MSPKEKVHFIRSTDFEAVDEELSEAMSGLDEANSRILELLNSETAPESGEEAAPDEPAAEAPPSGAPQAATGQDAGTEA